MRIAIDVKNQALFGGGIAHWAAEVLPAWIAACPREETILIAPEGEGTLPVAMAGARIMGIPWPTHLPRPLRHPVYDNLTFPRALAHLGPDLIFSPYHDVRIPGHTPAVITVHDLCYMDVPECYPWHLRSYYLAMLRINIARAKHVITVSQATRERLVTVLGLPETTISVVPNALDSEFSVSLPPSASIAAWRRDNGALQAGTSLLLYPGGIEYRKNLARLMVALRRLWADGERITLLVTGDLAPRWRYLFPEVETHTECVKFLGRLSLAQLRLAYGAVDGVVYPTLCEGFGRVCLEAMAAGSPIACSDLAVLREVAGNYPRYFNPMDPVDMAAAIRSICGAGRQMPRLDPRFSPETVRNLFIETMAPIVAKIKK